MKKFQILVVKLKTLKKKSEVLILMSNPMSLEQMRTRLLSNYVTNLRRI